MEQHALYESAKIASTFGIKNSENPPKDNI